MNSYGKVLTWNLLAGGVIKKKWLSKIGINRTGKFTEGAYKNFMDIYAIRRIQSKKIMKSAIF